MWFGLLPVRSPLLGESLLISVPELLRWFTSLSVAPVSYIFRHSGNSKNCWITPFGNPGVNGYVLLTPAYRSLSRPSSPDSSQASAIDLYSLGHIIFSALSLTTGIFVRVHFLTKQYTIPRSKASLFNIRLKIFPYVFRPSFVISKNFAFQSTGFFTLVRLWHTRERNN